MIHAKSLTHAKPEDIRKNVALNKTKDLQLAKSIE